jgi:CRISPR-associated protein Csx17
MTDLALLGCTPEPLMNYLKALGVFRLVAEQADPQARLSWRGGVAHLQSTLERDGLIEFFTNEYRPTPILAPWNGGSGFYGGGSEPLDAIADSNSSRLERYRQAIDRIRTFIPKAKPKDEEKDALLARCRRELADEVVPWLDVCFVLGEDGPRFFPLLGTGGNDGRLDFTNNFMQRVNDVIAFSVEAKTPGDSQSLLAAAVFADELTSLGRAAVGQFNPGGIGGANGTQGKFEAGSQVNPWDYVLMIEGALLFAGSVARRLGSNSTNRAVFPFTVESVAVGYGSATASEETTDGSRAELWLPIWKTSCSFAEVARLFAEGRAQLGRRQAKNAVEFALAVNLLGVSSGITSFARYGFLKRNGLAFLAAPLGRVEVRRRPQARLLEDPSLIEWLDRLRRACSDKDKTPGRYQIALRQIDRAIFGFANRSESDNDGLYLQNVLIAFGKAERTLAGGLRFAQDKYIRPLQGLNAQWLVDAGDSRSPEFRLAAALAGVRAQRDVVGPFRSFLEPVEYQGNYANWSPSSTSAVWSNQSLAANLADVFQRRHLEAFRNGFNAVPLKSQRTAPVLDVVAFLREEIDEEKLTALLWAMTAVDWPSVKWVPPESHGDEEWDVPFEFGLPRLLVEPLSLRSNTTANNDGRRWHLGSASHSTQPDPDVFHLLASGRPDAVERSVTRAARRLKSSGLLAGGYRNRRQSGTAISVVSTIAPQRLLAAMLFPLSDHDLEVIANQVLNPPETEE